MSAAPRRVLLLGLGTTTPSALESLAERFDVVGMVRPSPEDACAARAAELGVPVTTDTTIAAVTELVATTRPDCVVSSSYDRILGPQLLAAAPFVNVHYSPLPEYRGRANVNWAILNGEPETAISIHTMAPGLDAGSLLFQQRVPIGPRDHVGELYDRLNGIQREVLGEVVGRFLDGYPGEVQDESRATYGCTRLPGDGAIDWSAPTVQTDRLIRAVSDPFPGAFTHLDMDLLRVWRAEPAPDPLRFAGRVPGRVVARSAAQGWVDVLTGDGVLRLHQVQREGQPRTAAASVIRSVKATLGLSPASLLDRVRELEQQVAALAADRAGGPGPR